MRKSISPLLDCKWGQYSPYYNNLKISGKYQLVGCTALAIAQIAYYWMVQRGYHRGCKATPTYTTTTNKHKIEALPPLTVFDWKNLVPLPKTTEQKAAVATLCEYIGKALRSDYGRTNTSANRTAVENVLNYYLRMGECKHYYQSTTGKAKFDELIYDDLAHGRPVFLSSTSCGGHAFVIDGYLDGEYHVNWGWNGDKDGYYPLSALKPGTLNYSGSLMAVCNIQPQYKLGDANGDGKIDISDVVTVINAANKGKVSKPVDINLDGKVTKEDADIIVDHLIKGDVL